MFDIVAVFVNKVKCCFDIVADVYMMLSVAFSLLPCTARNGRQLNGRYAPLTAVDRYRIYANAGDGLQNLALLVCSNIVNGVRRRRWRTRAYAVDDVGTY